VPYPKGKPQSEVSKQLRREKMLARIAAGKFNADFYKAAFTPAAVARRAATNKANGNFDRAVIAMNASQARPDVRAKLAAERRARAATPAGRAAILATAAAAQTPEVNERRRAASRAYAGTTAGRAAKVRGGDAALKALGGAAASRRHDGFRSSWELRFARWLDSLGVRWVYEPEAFELADGKHYTPDFMVRVPGRASPLWVEIKALRRSSAAKFHAWRAEWGLEDQSILLAEDVFAALP
jgi:hypothetical protein